MRASRTSLSIAWNPIQEPPVAQAFSRKVGDVGVKPLV